jgi:hypothetical protein
MKTTVCTVLIVALALAIILPVAPAFAQTWSLTAKSNSPTYIQGAVVNINGSLKNSNGTVGANFLIALSVYDQAGKSVYGTLTTTGTAGTYSAQFTISPTEPNGTYEIAVAATYITGLTGQQVATAKATFVVGSLPTPTATPTARPSTSPTPEISEFPSVIIVAILLIAIATAILFYKRRKTAKVNSWVPPP